MLPNPTVHSCVPAVLHMAWLMHTFKPQAKSCRWTLGIEVGNWGSRLSRPVLGGLRVFRGLLYEVSSHVGYIRAVMHGTLNRKFILAAVGLVTPDSSYRGCQVKLTREFS